MGIIKTSYAWGLLNLYRQGGLLKLYRHEIIKTSYAWGLLKLHRHGNYLNFIGSGNSKTL